MLESLGFRGIELALSVNAIEHMGLPFDAAARRLWGTPLVERNAVTPPVPGSVLAPGPVGLNTDAQGVQVDFSETSNADDLVKEPTACSLRRAGCGDIGIRAVGRCDALI